MNLDEERFYEFQNEMIDFDKLIRKNEYHIEKVRKFTEKLVLKMILLSI
jgi:hypothetical protein